jgi:hypothetical protein
MIEHYTNKLTNKVEDVNIPLNIQIQEITNGFLISKAGYQNEQGIKLIEPRAMFALNKEEVCKVIDSFFPAEISIIEATSINDLRK